MRKTSLCVAGMVMMTVTACRDNVAKRSDSARGSLPPVFPASPLVSTNWDLDAGPLMILSTSAADTVAVVLPEATDSTIASFQNMMPPVAGLTFDLFSRGGKLGSLATLSPLPSTDSTDECYAWPQAKLHSAATNWRVGFAAGRVLPVRIDSIEALSSPDSAALAAAITRTAASLPVSADPAFRGLPFRVRSAYGFELDSVDVVIADVVRVVNEEANPRIEHLMIIGERPTGSHGKFEAAYFNRTAGAEESTQVMDVLAIIKLLARNRPAIVVAIESDDARRVGLIERTGAGVWSLRWRSASTDC